MFNFLPSRPPQNRPLCLGTPVGHATLGLRLTTTQSRVHDALLAALLGKSPCVLVTGAAGFGKTTVLTAALSSLAEADFQVFRFDDAEGGIEDAFRALFPSGRRRPFTRQHSERRFVLVVDQMDAKPPASFTYLELLNRMPGKTAPIQWVFVGRSAPWDRLDGVSAAWVREANPLCLVLSPLQEQDAWELFHHRVSASGGSHSAAKLVTTLLKQSDGLPGRFDATIKAAVAAGLLQGIPAQAA